MLGARIRKALEVGDRSHVFPAEPAAGDPMRSERHRRALGVMDERADLVDFALTSRLKGVGQASRAVRGAVRRALLEVLHRQTEHNRASDDLIRSHDAQLEALTATVRAQLEIQARADERLDALERRLAAVEVNSATSARQAGGAGSRSD